MFVMPETITASFVITALLGAVVAALLSYYFNRMYWTSRFYGEFRHRNALNSVLFVGSAMSITLAACQVSFLTDQQLGIVCIAFMIGSGVGGLPGAVNAPDKNEDDD